MKTILVDKNNNVINEGDIVKIKSNLVEYPGMYHYGMYKVSFDLIRGLALTFDALMETNDLNNQTIGTYELRMNEHLYIWRCDCDKDTVYCRINVNGNTFVKIEATSDVEKL